MGTRKEILDAATSVERFGSTLDEITKAIAGHKDAIDVLQANKAKVRADYEAAIVALRAAVEELGAGSPGTA